MKSILIPILMLLGLGALPGVIPEAAAQAGLTDSFAKAEFQSRVKSLEEFVDRFNGVSGFEGATRRDLLMSLFDASNPLNLEGNREFYDAVEEFVTKVDSENIFLSLPSDSVTACVKLNITTPVVTDKEVVISLTPTYHPVRTNEWGWGISGVEGVTEADFVAPRRVALLNPFSADNHFQKLPSDLASATEDVWLYRSSTLPADALNLLLYGLSTGNVTLSTPHDMWLRVASVPGFPFTVREYDRQGSNAGWRIAELWAHGNP